MTEENLEKKPKKSFEKREKTEKSDWQFPLRGEICQSDSVE